MGITPAGAGKTTEGTLSAFICRDHPRRCGENQIQTTDRGKGQGSPPQVRGKRRLGRYDKTQGGITPAGAGKTRRWTSKAARYRGSPPQVRGKLLCKACRAKSNRITPAGAGKTKLYHLFLSCQPDHPRRCGENFFYRNRKKKVTDHPRRCGENRTTQSGKNYCLGSPPQVRGKRKVSFRKSKALRITPAGAGKTLNKSSIYSKSQDHPRRCGEN